MVKSVRVSVAEIEAVLITATLRQLQIIQVALTAGVLVFLAMVLGFWGLATPEQGASPDNVPVLSIIHGVAAFCSYAISTFLYATQLAPERIRNPLVSDDSSGTASGIAAATQFIEMLRTAIIVRLALFEAPAVLGLAVCGIAAASGVIETQSEYWLNASTTLIFLLFSILTFPTRERVQWIIEEKLGPSLPS